MKYQIKAFEIISINDHTILKTFIKQVEKSSDLTIEIDKLKKAGCYSNITVSKIKNKSPN